MRYKGDRTASRTNRGSRHRRKKRKKQGIVNYIPL